MNKNILLPIVLLFCCVNIYSQDFFKIKIGPNSNHYVKPTKIVNDNLNEGVSYSGYITNSRYVAYELRIPNSSTGLNKIGIMRIDPNSNTTLYNTLYSFDQNETYNSRVTDIEVYMDKLYVLISINYSDVLLITLNKFSGTLIKKEFFKVNNPSEYTGFLAEDLFITSYEGGSLSNPQIGILGIYSFGENHASGFSNLTLFHKLENDNSFTEVKFVNPYKWASLYVGEKILRLSPESVSIISNDQWGAGGIIFDFSFTSQVVLNAKHYNVDHTHMRFFSQMSYDGVSYLYGQLHHSLGNEYTPGQSNDIFIINETYSTLETFNNPNFLGFKGDDQSYGKGGLYINFMSIFGGYYFSNSSIGNPYYGIVKLDFTFFGPLISGFGFPLSTKGKDTYNITSPGTYGGFDPLYYSLTHNVDYHYTTNPGGVFERKSKDNWTDLNAIYYMNNLTNSTCSESFSFERTYGKNLFVNDDFTQLERISNKTLDNITTYNEFLPPSPHVLVCNESILIPGGKTDNFTTKDTSTIFVNPIQSESFTTTLKNNIKVYPNPITSNYAIFSSEIEMQSIQIYDILKRPLYEKRNINAKQVHVQLSFIESGVYVAVIKDKNNKISIIKLLK